MKFSIATALLSIGSAAAAPLAISNPLGTATAALSGIQTTVQGELKTITGLVSVGGLTQTVAPQVQASLKTIETTLSGATKTVVPLLSNLSLPLAGNDLKIVSQLVSQLQSSVTGVKSTLTSLVGTAEAEAITLVKPEIQLVLNTVLPLVTPISQFALGAVANVADAPELVSEITTGVGSLTSLANGLLSPVGSILGGLLGGL